MRKKKMECNDIAGSIFDEKYLYRYKSICIRSPFLYFFVSCIMFDFFMFISKHFIMEVI